MSEHLIFWITLMIKLIGGQTHATSPSQEWLKASMPEVFSQ